MIGLLGGTFDPIHFGHLRPAMDLLDELGLDHVRLIPCGVPPHRAAPRAHAEHRLTMLRLAVSGEPRLRVDERELRRPGPSYMVDTVLSLREELGDTPLALIIGMDALNGLATWRRWRKLVDLCHLIVMERPGGTAPATGELAALVAARRVYEVADLRARAAGGLVFHRNTDQLRELALAALDDLKAKDVKVLDVRTLTGITDYMIIASGTSTRHVKSLADSVVEKAKQAGSRPLSVEGEREAEWILVDLADVVVHVMLPTTRDFYQLENLWDAGEARARKTQP